MKSRLAKKNWQTNIQIFQLGHKLPAVFYQSAEESYKGSYKRL